MAYELAKDVALHLEEGKNGKKEDLLVGIYSYNGGTPKLRVNRRRRITTKEGSTKQSFKNIGGMTLAEIVVFVPLFKRAVAKLQELNVAVPVAPTPVVPVAPIAPVAPQPPAMPVMQPISL